jgi:hypothetical protein
VRPTDIFPAFYQIPLDLVQNMMDNLCQAWNMQVLWRVSALSIPLGDPPIGFEETGDDRPFIPWEEWLGKKSIE